VRRDGKFVVPDRVGAQSEIAGPGLLEVLIRHAPFDPVRLTYLIRGNVYFGSYTHLNVDMVKTVSVIAGLVGFAQRWTGGSQLECKKAG
jgi:hypothetical protein